MLFADQFFRELRPGDLVGELGRRWIRCITRPGDIIFTDEVEITVELAHRLVAQSVDNGADAFEIRRGRQTVAQIENPPVPPIHLSDQSLGGGRGPFWIAQKQFRIEIALHSDDSREAPPRPPPTRYRDQCQSHPRPLRRARPSCAFPLKKQPPATFSQRSHNLLDPLARSRAK